MTFLKLVSSSNVVVRELWRQMGHCGDNNDDSGVDSNGGNGGDSDSNNSGGGRDWKHWW